MDKEQKTAVVEELTEELKGAGTVFAIDYRGISVPQAAELRAGLRDADTRFRVVKNRLTLRAADAAGTEEIKEHLSGPTALALVSGDVALAAKTIRRLGDEWELLAYKGGLMEGGVLEPDSFVAIAKLPGREQLDAQFAGIVASPLTGLVRGLGSMVQGLALQLQAIADQGLVSGEEPPKEVESPAGGGDEEGADDATAAAEDGSSDQGDPDPDPAESPEEEPSEETAPEGEEAGQAVEQTGEGDAEPGSAQGDDADDSSDSDAGGDETSDDSDENKEDDS